MQHTQRELEFLQRMADQAGKGALSGKRPASETEKKSRALAIEASMFLTSAERSKKQSNRPHMKSDAVNFIMFV